MTDSVIFVEYPDATVDEFHGEVVYERDATLIYEAGGVSHRINHSHTRAIHVHPTTAEK
ncbi:hypothetical protein ABZ714_12960 [Streptomyces sp. NPDC006798]|uniref:hypothetical protein n=1 Tax=Streptomyces sp. NPDC006798 TaxID=3155462 RepID=UPI0033E1C54A